MIENRIGDIFEQEDLTHLVHQANLFHTFGSGIAQEIKRRFPYAYDADKETIYGDHQKLGTYSYGSLGLGEVGVYNIYSQDGIGGKDRQTNYAAMGMALLAVERSLRFKDLPKMLLGLPHGIGCGLANGDWSVVQPIIESVFAKSSVRVVVCKKDKLTCPKCKKFAGWYECFGHPGQVFFCVCEAKEHENCKSWSNK